MFFFFVVDDDDDGDDDGDEKKKYFFPSADALLSVVCLWSLSHTKMKPSELYSYGHTHNVDFA